MKKEHVITSIKGGQAIYDHIKKNEMVVSRNVAQEVGVTPPTVLRAIKRFVEFGLIEETYKIGCTRCFRVLDDNEIKNCK